MFYNSENKEWKIDKKYNIFLGTDSKNVKLIGELDF